MDPDKLNPLDLRLLHALQLDGRASFARIAEVARRLRPHPGPAVRPDTRRRSPS